MNSFTRTVTIIAAVGAAASGGVFLAFSTFVMRAMGRLPDRDGLIAMQAINRAAPTPVFMTALFGTALACGGLIVVALRHPDEPYASRLLVGGALFLACIALTIAYHVPRNDALALIDPDSAGAAAAWVRYARNWTLWNHARTVVSLAGAAALTMSLVADR